MSLPIYKVALAETILALTEPCTVFHTHLGQVDIKDMPPEAEALCEVFSRASKTKRGTVDMRFNGAEEAREAGFRLENMAIQVAFKSFMEAGK